MRSSKTSQMPTQVIFIFWSSKLQDNNGRKNALVAQCVCIRCLKSNSEVSKSNLNILDTNYFFLKNYFTSDEPFLTVFFFTINSSP